MKKWEEFEKKILDYLKLNYEKSNIKFYAKGGSDSTIPDIKVSIKDKKDFFLEAKMSNAQSGQFVLLKTDSQFIYSDKNKSENNQFTDKILNYINENFETFKSVKSRGIDIKLPNTLFSDWIINYYKNKNVQFVVTEFNNELIIFPIEKFNDYFEVKAVLRRKKSGSSNLPKKDLENIKSFFYDDKIIQENKSFFLLSEKRNNKEKFSISNANYQLSLTTKNKYKIRKLGKTNNPNIIFSVKCIKGQDLKDLAFFENTLK